MALQYCEGNPLQAETIFGWSRWTVGWGSPKDARASGVSVRNRPAVAANGGKTRLPRPLTPSVGSPTRMRHKTRYVVRPWPLYA